MAERQRVIVLHMTQCTTPQPCTCGQHQLNLVGYLILFRKRDVKSGGRSVGKAELKVGRRELGLGCILSIVYIGEKEKKGRKRVHFLHIMCSK